MKEQDAAHSFDNTLKEGKDVPFADYFKLYSNYAKHDETIRAQQSELTRDREENR